MRVRNARADLESSTTSASRAVMPCPLVTTLTGSYRMALGPVRTGANPRQGSRIQAAKVGV